MSFLKNIFKSKEEPITSVDAFWQWFVKNEKEFHRVVKLGENIEKDFFNKLSPRLAEIYSEIYFVAGLHDEDTAQLIFTAEGSIRNIAFAEQLVQLAPDIPGWIFTALKPALDIEDVSIRMGDFNFNKNNLYFYAHESDGYPDEIDITIVHDDMNDESKPAIINGIYVFLDNYLGELNFAASIDNLRFAGKQQVEKELIPITKLKDFLNWRQKEFIEKYEGTRHHTEKDNYTVMEGKTAKGDLILATIDTDLLRWDSKASHPWVLVVEVPYDGTRNKGMPDEAIYHLLDSIENGIMAELIDEEGYLNVGRQTSNNKRDIFFACKDFRKPSFVLQKVQQKYGSQAEISYDLYKDKYWRSFSHFMPSL